MSAKAIDYKIILKRDGQTQQQRMPAWLDPSLVPVDDRTKEQFFNYLKEIAKQVNFYDLHKINHTLIVNGTWEDFFNLSADELTNLAAQASLPPHIALWNSFMSIYEYSQKLMNTITQRHLDFYYGNVLRLSKNEPVPDKAHVLFDLKKNTADTLLSTGTALLAGKDNTNKDLHYKLTHDIVVNKSKVAQLKSLYVTPANKNFVHYAPVANSADGLGGELDKTNPKWPAFGNSSLPTAQIGFCLASDVLKMKEGDRTVKVNFTLSGLSESAKTKAFTNNLFIVSITGEKGWIGPTTVSVDFTSADGVIFSGAFEFAISKDEAAVVAYDAKIHGQDFNTSSPLLQILLNNGKSDFGYKDLQGADLRDATITVVVKNAKDLQLENDLGTLNPTKPFAPFGPSPDVNANFSIKSEEAFAKRLKEFSVDVEWKNIPDANLKTYFTGYGLVNTTNADFTAMASFHDAFNWQGSKPVNLFNTTDAKSGVTWQFNNGGSPVKIAKKLLPEISIKQNKSAGLTVTQKLNNNLSQLVPGLAAMKPMIAAPAPAAKKPVITAPISAAKKSVINAPVSAAALKPITGAVNATLSPSIGTPIFATLSPAILSPVVFAPLLVLIDFDFLKAPVVTGWINTDKDKRTGKLNLSLQHGFLFKEYRKKYTEDILAFSKKNSGTLNVINEPFTPEIQSIKFNYTASTAKTSFSGTSLNDYVDEEVELFHYGAFGQMREHAYQKSQHSFLNNSNVKLLPEYKNEGEFFIGLSGLMAEDAACVLFQVAEGSADPDKPKVAIKWSVLCDNYWKELTNEDTIFDTTNDFLTNGVIKFVIPPQATTINTIMPTNLLWLKAAITSESNAVCNMLDVQSNAAIAIFDNQQNDPLHLATALASNTINKIENEVASIKSVRQPYSSFGGQMQENDNVFYIRVSERLRHKERSIALWDYERLLLQHFPKIHKVKCINHATDTSFYEPGNVLIILVPDLTNQNAVNPLQPRVDKNTVDEVKTFIQAHSTSWAEHHVRNPFYEPVKISATIKLKTGFEFNYYQKIIDQKLQEFLSPWVNNKASDIHFGGKITKSMIVKFLEDLEFVDYITSLTLQQFTGTTGFSNAEVVEASNPASILVSADHHDISNYTG